MSVTFNLESLQVTYDKDNFCNLIMYINGIGFYNIELENVNMKYVRNGNIWNVCLNYNPDITIFDIAIDDRYVKTYLNPYCFNFRLLYCELVDNVYKQSNNSTFLFTMQFQRYSVYRSIDIYTIKLYFNTDKFYISNVEYDDTNFYNDYGIVATINEKHLCVSPSNTKDTYKFMDYKSDQYSKML